MQSKSSNSAGIREIAEALSISIGTVDRALHARPGVSAKTAARVLKMAEQLAYRPNQAARSLKMHRRLRIAVHLPRQIASFFDPLRRGIQKAAVSAIGVQADLEFEIYPRLGHGDIELLEAAIERRYDGIIMTPGDPAKVDPILSRLAASGTAVVCIASDAPHSKRIGSVAVDAFTSGAIAAELLGRTLPLGGPVATITGDLTTLDHADKLRGFAATLATLSPGLSLLPALESHESPEEAYRQTSMLFSRRVRPVGIYISTANSVPVLNALRERRLLGKVQIVTTDLFPAIVPLIESGQILATLYQRPYAQARVAFEMMTRYLLDGAITRHSTKLAPHIILRSNLHLFTDYMHEDEGT
jgi:LacI family transcriptional regulator